MLVEAGIENSICRDVDELVREMAVGAGFGLITEDALVTSDLHPLADWLGGQPEWSDFPFVLLTHRSADWARLIKVVG